MEIQIPEDFFITSDTWFGRKEILKIANRDFKNVTQMNDELIKRWNKKVKKDDVVFHLGNFAWDPMSASYALELLNGKIFFITGNSDLALSEVVENFENCMIINADILDIELETYKYDLVVSHYPLEVWNGKSLGTIHAHGHCVYSHKTDLSLMKRFNVCTDFWNYSPINISLLKDILESKNL